MTRFTFRVTSASALVLMTTIAVCFVVCEAWAQENERPFGLFGLFNGSERLGGEPGAPPAGADRMAQMSGPDLVLRLERLETQIRQLTGTIEQLQFPNQQLEGQIRRMQEEAAAGAALATLAPSQSPRDEYDLAYGYVLRKDYALAEEAFRSFLSKYPDDRLVGDATYWLGESMFQRQRFRDAAEAFLNVSTKYESSAKAPDALLRLGQSLAALGEKEAACASLGEVLRKFPRASAGVKQGVEREQKRVRC